jgi:hypothetical protein
MVGSIANSAPTQPVAQSTATSAPKPVQAKPQSTAGGDSVQLSAAAQALLDAMQEATETPFLTAKEASQGDLQAQRLLARQAAAKSAAG